MLAPMTTETQLGKTAASIIAERGHVAAARWRDMLNALVIDRGYTIKDAIQAADEMVMAEEERGLYEGVEKELDESRLQELTALMEGLSTAIDGLTKKRLKVDANIMPMVGGMPVLNEDPMEGSPFRSVVSIDIGDTILLTNTTLPTRMNGVYDVITIQPDGDKVLITLERPSSPPSSPTSP
jgi:hypothetical protein